MGVEKQHEGEERAPGHGKTALRCVNPALRCANLCMFRPNNELVHASQAELATVFTYCSVQYHQQVITMAYRSTILLRQNAVDTKWDCYSIIEMTWMTGRVLSS